MRAEIVILEPVHENYGVEVVADGANPVQLVLRSHRTYIAQLSAEEARQLADALRLAASVTPEEPPAGD